MEITLSVAKSAVMNEVAKQTSYIGAKMTTPDGENAYDKVFTTNDDYGMLERYWRDALTAATGSLRRFVKSISATPPPSSVDMNEVFDLVLTVPKGYDDKQTGGISGALFSYFVNFITSRWLFITHREDAAHYDGRAADNMREVLLKIYYKKPPERPID
jgi:hypothetical protein